MHRFASPEKEPQPTQVSLRSPRHLRKTGAMALVATAVLYSAAACSSSDRAQMMGNNPPLGSLDCGKIYQYRTVEGSVSANLIKLVFAGDADNPIGIEIRNGKVAVAKQASFENRTVSGPGSFSFYAAGKTIFDSGEYSLIAGAWQSGTTYAYTGQYYGGEDVVAITEECDSTIQQGIEGETVNVEINPATPNWDNAGIQAH